MVFTLFLKIIPNSSINKFSYEGQDWKLKITAPPVDGKANLMVIKLLSDIFSCPKTTIEIVSGVTSKRKKIIFHKLSMEEGQEILKKLLL